MLKGEQKILPKQFFMKANVDYHSRNLQLGMCNELYSRDKQLYYYKHTFLPISNTISVYIQEYAYNHVAHIVDYRDTDGIKWQKQYTDTGFEICYKNSLYKRAYKFDYTKNKLFVYSSRGIETCYDTLNIDDIFVLDGVDFSDRFITENEELIDFFIGDLDNEELIHKLLSFRDPLIQSTMLKRKGYKND